MSTTGVDGSDAFMALVQAADPLRADDTCGHLPEMNRAADVNGMIAVLRRWAPALAAVTEASVPDGTAAMRDAGIFLGSLKKHGVEPLDALPELAPALQRLGARTGMVPRDTIFHYTVWNPTDHRQRRYTDDVQERHLQDSVRMVVPDVRAGLEICVELMRTDPTDPSFAPLLERLSGHLRPMVDSMGFVRQSVSPEFFTHRLRPYLEDITLDGARYFGPAAAQLPMWLFDLALWGARAEPEYRRFWEGLVPYALPRWRALHDAWRERAPLTTGVTAALERASGPGEDRRRLVAAGEALVKAISVLVQFRGRHLSIAKQAYNVSSSYEVGSGGGSVALLRQILEQTRDSSSGL